MQFLPPEAIKGQVLADFLAENPTFSSRKHYVNIPGKVVEVHAVHTILEEQIWWLFFDGASRVNPRGDLVAGTGVVIVFIQNHVIHRAFLLTKPCSNNEAEYDSLLIRMRVAYRLGIRNLKAYDDYQLIVYLCRVNIRSGS